MHGRLNSDKGVSQFPRMKTHPSREKWRTKRNIYRLLPISEGMIHEVFYEKKAGITSLYPRL